MKHWIRILIPCGLGFCAFLMNGWAMTQKLQPLTFVRIAADVKEGELIEAKHLTSVNLSGDLGSLPKVAVPIKDIAVAFQTYATRDLKAGDPLLWRDFSPRESRIDVKQGEVQLPISIDQIAVVPQLINPGDKVGFFIGKNERNRRYASDNYSDPSEEGQTYLGPFRVLSMGAHSNPLGGRVDEREDRTYGRILTVAATQDEQTRELDEASRRLLNAASENSSERIIAIVMHSSK